MSDTFALPEPSGLEAAFNEFRELAWSLSKDRLSRSRGKALVARGNLLTSIENLRPHRALLEERWNKARVDRLFSGLGVADGLVFAERRAEGIEASEKTLRADIARSYVTRDLLISTLELMAKFGLLPAERVAALRSGTGPLDTALDNIGAVAVFREFEKKLAGKTPVTLALLEEAQTLGNSLQARITPEDQQATPSQEEPDPRAEAFELALRFWTLVAGKHAEARMAGREIWGNAFHLHVPALQAEEETAAKKDEPEAPAA